MLPFFSVRRERRIRFNIIPNHHFIKYLEDTREIRVDGVSDAWSDPNTFTISFLVISFPHLRRASATTTSSRPSSSLSATSLLHRPFVVLSNGSSRLPGEEHRQVIESKVYRIYVYLTYLRLTDWIDMHKKCIRLYYLIVHGVKKICPEPL